MRFAIPLLALSLLLPACKPDEPPTEIVYYDANKKLDVDVEEAREEEREREEEAVETARTRTNLEFARLEVFPETVKVDDTIEAEATLKPGASPFAEIEYTWYVNDRDVRGIQAPRLDKRTGRFAKGDKVKVVATAIDDKGRTTSITSDTFEIANTPPDITTNAARRTGIDGLVLRAEDADGDRVEWSIVSGPPGIAIDQSGRVTVTQTNLRDAFDGEVVIAATDPDGGRGEWHVPVSINAAVEEVQAERTVTTRVRSADMTDEEYARLQLESADRVMDMSEEEFERHTREQEQREAEERERRERR